MYCFILTSWNVVCYQRIIFTQLTDFYRTFYFETGARMQIRGLGEKMYVQTLYKELFSFGFRGFSTVSPDCTGVAVTNIRTGIDWYKISTESQEDKLDL